MARRSTSLNLTRSSSDLCACVCVLLFFFFNDTATTEIYTLSLHDALPICFQNKGVFVYCSWEQQECGPKKVVFTTSLQTLLGRGIPPPEEMTLSDMALLRRLQEIALEDRKSTRLNSSHALISYAVFCLKKKNNKKISFKY